MAIYRMFPIPEVDDLKPSSQLLYDAASFPGSESFAMIGDNSIIMRSLLYQAALSSVEDGDRVIFICPGHYKQLPFPVHGMTATSSLLMDCIQMMYISEPLGLIRYLCEFHMSNIYPSAIIIEDFFYYVAHHQEHNRDAAVLKLFGLLEDVTSYISQKRNKPCHRVISIHRSPSPKGSLKKYFQEIWHLSFTDNSNEIILTDDHIPAFRIVFHVENAEKIMLDKLFRLPAVESS